MNNDDRCFCELAPLYALDLLDEQERAWVEQQAAASSDLATELVEIQATVGAISYSAEPVPMAADLKDRLFQQLTQEQVEPVRELPPRQAEAQRIDLFELPARGRTPSRRNRQWLQVGGAIAALALITLLVDNYRLRQTTQETQSVIAALQQPDTILYTLRGTENATNASGSLVVNPTQKTLTILVQNLPQLPSDQIYRLWAMPKGSTKPSFCGQFNSLTETPTQLSDSDAVCKTAVSQMLITAESATAPLVPAGSLVMKSVL
ncbi:anti-sigma factor [Phormidesmis priestleyi]